MCHAHRVRDAARRGGRPWSPGAAARVPKLLAGQAVATGGGDNCRRDDHRRAALDHACDQDARSRDETALKPTLEGNKASQIAEAAPQQEASGGRYRVNKRRKRSPRTDAHHATRSRVRTRIERSPWGRIFVLNVAKFSHAHAHMNGVRRTTHLHVVS